MPDYVKHIIAHLDQPNPAFAQRVLAIQKTCLGATVLLGVTGLLAGSFPALRGWMPAATVMSVSAALVAIACAVSLAISIGSAGSLGRWLAAGSVLLSLVALPWGAGNSRALSQWLSVSDHPAIHPGEMTVQFSGAFLLLAVVLLLAGAERGLVSHIADVVTALLCLSTLFLTARWLFELSGIFPATFRDPTPPAALAALDLLAIAAVLLRARHGAFDILLANGLGGRMTRGLLPIVLIFPLLREASRERIVRAGLAPGHAIAAILGSLACILGIALLFLVTHSMRRMEREIRNLSLRDELTGLYNLRGFKLLAEQALRLAQRSNAPFSVLFIDVDDLKLVNDTSGHAVGSAFLIETAELLKASFRETDVLGRIGGDEFAVAGQFTRAAIVEAADRLQEQASLTRNEANEKMPISISIGHVTSTPGGQDTLQQLLDKADAAMYDQKRRKKLQLCNTALTGSRHSRR